METAGPGWGSALSSRDLADSCPGLAQIGRETPERDDFGTTSRTALYPVESARDGDFRSNRPIISILLWDRAPHRQRRKMQLEWRRSEAPVGYDEAMAAMAARVEAIGQGQAPNLVWLLEHPPLYTAGTSARDEDLIEPDRFPVYRTGRGGQFTYHGPGQRIGYVMLDLKARGQDIRRYISDLEAWLILALAEFGIVGERRRGRVGIWVRGPDGGEAKIAAIGVRVRRWVAFHGVALNVAPALEHFDGIVPCGLAGYGVTSLAALDRAASIEHVDAALTRAFLQIFQ
jgi:lipoyl(octanoyl) transferase